ncbi:hypothetical protein KM043_000028, partial [Ampulex compressa]
MTGSAGLARRKRRALDSEEESSAGPLRRRGRLEFGQRGPRILAAKEPVAGVAGSARGPTAREQVRASERGSPGER